MAQAIWNGAVIAESNETVYLEGNHYFPREAVKHEYLRESDEHTVCFWKGVASYYDIEVNGDVNPGGAWYYPDPSDAALQIKDHIAFWRGVKIEK